MKRRILLLKLSQKNQRVTVPQNSVVPNSPFLLNPWRPNFRHSTQLPLSTQKGASQMWPSCPQSTVLAQQQAFSKAAQGIQMLARVEKHQLAGKMPETEPACFQMSSSSSSLLLGDGSTICSGAQANSSVPHSESNLTEQPLHCSAFTTHPTSSHAPTPQFPSVPQGFPECPRVSQHAPGFLSMPSVSQCAPKAWSCEHNQLWSELSQSLLPHAPASVTI